MYDNPFKLVNDISFTSLNRSSYMFLTPVNKRQNNEKILWYETQKQKYSSFLHTVALRTLYIIKEKGEKLIN